MALEALKLVGNTLVEDWTGRTPIALLVLPKRNPRASRDSIPLARRGGRLNLARLLAQELACVPDVKAKGAAAHLIEVTPAAHDGKRCVDVNDAKAIALLMLLALPLVLLRGLPLVAA